jgi:hypothetical protein
MSDFRKLLLAFIAVTILSGIASAQMGAGKADGIDYFVSYIGMPCDSAKAGSYPCPPELYQGFMVQINEASPVKTKISVQYTTKDGEERGAWISFTPSRDWETKPFRIGRVKSQNLDGVTIIEIRIEREGHAPIVIRKQEQAFAPTIPPTDITFKVTFYADSRIRTLYWMDGAGTAYWSPDFATVISKSKALR